MATETSGTGRESDKFMLRFPDGMRALIKEAAEQNGRTMNSEIIARLNDSFARSDLARGDDGLDDLIARTVENTLNSMLKAGWLPRSGVVDDREVNNVTDALADAADQTKADTKKSSPKGST